MTFNDPTRGWEGQIEETKYQVVGITRGTNEKTVLGTFDEYDIALAFVNDLDRPEFAAIVIDFISVAI